MIQESASHFPQETSTAVVSAGSSARLQAEEHLGQWERHCYSILRVHADGKCQGCKFGSGYKIGNGGPLVLHMSWQWAA